MPSHDKVKIEMLGSKAVRVKLIGKIISPERDQILKIIDQGLSRAGPDSIGILIDLASIQEFDGEMQFLVSSISIKADQMRKQVLVINYFDEHKNVMARKYGVNLANNLFENKSQPNAIEALKGSGGQV